ITEFLLHYIEAHSCRSQSEIATAAGKFPEPEVAVSRPCRETNFGDDLVRLQSSQQRSPEEFAGGNRAPAFRAERDDFCLAGDGNTRQLRGRISVRQATPDGTAIADLKMGDVLDR